MEVSKVLIIGIFVATLNSVALSAPLKPSASTIEVLVNDVISQILKTPLKRYEFKINFPCLVYNYIMTMENKTNFVKWKLESHSQEFVEYWRCLERSHLKTVCSVHSGKRESQSLCYFSIRRIRNLSWQTYAFAFSISIWVETSRVFLFKQGYHRMSSSSYCAFFFVTKWKVN